MTTGIEFAYPVFDSEGNSRCGGGLTKREYFAAMAMQGIMSGVSGLVITQEILHNTANESVRCADALINELNKHT